MALVPVANATRLVPATSLFARMPEALDLAPFLFQLPSPFLPHASLLADLGMADHPSPPLLHTFLTALQRTCGYQRLNPNELRCVLQIVAYISQGQVSMAHPWYASVWTPMSSVACSRWWPTSPRGKSIWHTPGTPTP